MRLFLSQSDCVHIANEQQYSTESNKAMTGFEVYKISFVNFAAYRHIALPKDIVQK